MLTTHTALSESLGQKPHIVKKMIRETGTPYLVRNGMYLCNRSVFEEKLEETMMKTATEKKGSKAKKTTANKKAKAKTAAKEARAKK